MAIFVQKELLQSLASIPFLAFALFRIHGAYAASGGHASGPLPFPFWWFGIPFVGIGASMLLSPIWYFYRGVHTAYALTSQRAIIDYSGVFGQRLSFPLGEIPFVELSSSPRGTGHVLFRDMPASNYNRGMSQRDGFIAVRDVAQVEQQLRTAIAKFPDARLGAKSL